MDGLIIKAYRNVLAGYQYELKVECYNNPNHVLSDTRFVVTLQALDCLGTLSPIIAEPYYLQTTLPYDSSIQTPEDIFQNNIEFTSWDYHFGVLYTPCLTTSCDLHSSKDGGSTWVQLTSSDNVYTDGLIIKAKRNVLAGYSFELKV